jgi:ATP-dependent exoDNAse (exonuclease V) beta subunit
MSDLHLKLQGENQLLPDLYTHIKSFRQKIVLFQSQLNKKCFMHFNTCQTFSQQTETQFPVDFAIEALDALKINFESRFFRF